jgi:16S rRNA (adenine1518-N6/adenine1519-N6)-dimethyltransferase
VSKKVFVPKTSFFPIPKIDSLVLHFQIHHTYDTLDDTIFLSFIKICFSHPRKKMLHNLKIAGYNPNDFL